MNETERDNKLQELSGWSYNPEKKCLTKVFSFKSYLKTISFVNAVAWLANRDNHHPDLIVSFGKCTIELTTHDEGDVGAKDFKLARAIDEL